MNPHEDFVPKVHPLDRFAAPEDPLELMAEPAPGDPRVMLDCLLQEFLALGWESEPLYALFGHPGYPVLNQLRAVLGEDEVRRRIAELSHHWGQVQFREIFVDDEPPAEHEIELVQLTLPAEFYAGGAPRCGEALSSNGFAGDVPASPTCERE
jgi:hypothetical protein